MIYETVQNFPADIGQTDVTLRAVNIVGEQRGPFNAKREIQVFPGAHWEIEVAFLPVLRAEAQRLEAFLLSLRGKAGTFRLADPYRSLPLGSNLGTPLVRVATVAGDEAVLTKGWTINQVDALKAGDFIEIGTRLHMVLQDADADASGNATVNVWPPIRQVHAVNAPLITRNARGVFALDANAVEFTRGVNGYNGAILRAVEVV
jgi:hypothetical protein